MNLDIDKDWFAKKSMQEGDLEIGVGMRKTLTVDLTSDEIAILERLVNPEAAAQRARNAELSKTIEHWRHEVGKLHSQIDALKAENDRMRDTIQSVIRFGWPANIETNPEAGKKPSTDDVWTFPRHMLASIEAIADREVTK